MSGATTSTTSTTGVTVDTATVGTTGAEAASPHSCLTTTPPSCYTPQVFRTAYGIRPLLNRGIDGRGETVALPEVAQTGSVQAPAVTDIRQDLADFNSQFALPPARIRLITTMAGSSASPWLANREEVEDTELVHAVAPRATILEILISPADMASAATATPALAEAVRIAAKNAQVFSSSIAGQFCGADDAFTSTEVKTFNSALSYATAHHVTVISGSGDEGVFPAALCPPDKGVILPPSYPLVLGVGGTSLTANPTTGAYVSETAWNTPPGPKDDHSGASGGGFSSLFPKPSYQKGVAGIGAMRGVPDVAADADPSTGMALAVSYAGGTYRLTAASGTSAGGPFWAGLIALADQKAGHPLGFVNPAIYRIARGPQYHKAFHDITIGNNSVDLTSPPTTMTGYQAGPGWDPVTGWGTPDAQVLVSLLAH